MVTVIQGNSAVKFILQKYVFEIVAEIFTRLSK